MARRRDDPVPLQQAGLRTAKQRFRRIFPAGFKDETYLAWERDYKWKAHRAFSAVLGRAEWKRLLARDQHQEIASRLIAFYGRSRLNMLALYEWMALREALTDRRGARSLTAALFELIHGDGAFADRLDFFTEVLDQAPQRQTRLAKWPVVTLFPFVAQPKRHMILKPALMKNAAVHLGFDLDYRSRPNGRTYLAMLKAVVILRADLAAWAPRDLIDMQGFIWVTQSEEYRTWPWPCP